MNESPFQRLIKSLSSVCFSGLVLVVLVLTVIAVTYQPPDPLLDTGRAISLVFSSVKNATFKDDDSVIQTGEDFEPTTPVSAQPPISLTELDSASSLPFDCNHTSINCSDSGVLVTIMRYNMDKFPNLNFLAYQLPVHGSEANQCDVAWRFRSKIEKSWRMYRDFRRFALQLNESCSYVVNQSFGWHSGVNAKHLLRWRNVTERARVRHLPVKNATVAEELEVIEDGLPSLELDSFKNRRYLVYSRSGDHCKSMNQYLWSFMCALGEAEYLNRTLVMDLRFCLSGANNPGHADEDGKDFRFYFDFVHLKELASVVERTEFFRDWNLWNLNHKNDKASVKRVDNVKVTPMQLSGDDSTIVMRAFKPNEYWFRVCEGETEKVIQRPWHLLWKSKRIMNIVNEICGQLEWDFDAVHIVRGDKAKNKELWPNLEDETSVDSVIEKLQDQVDASRKLYVATNERDIAYFSKLKRVYANAYFLDDFSALWAENSLWYNQTLGLTHGRVVDFDGYMRVEVDTEVMYRAKRKFETFGFLTKDCKDGVNTC